MSMILFEEKDLEEIVQDTLSKFNRANLDSDSAKKAISRRILEGVKNQSESLEVDDQQFLSAFKN